MKFQYIIFIWSGFLLANFLAEAYQVTCYNCVNTSDKRCTEKAPPDTLPTETRQLTDSHYQRGLYPACRKEVIKNHTTFPATTYVIRDHVDLPNSDGDSCQRTKGVKHITIETCWCKGNYCNGSPSTSSVPYTFVALCVLGSVLGGYIRK